MRTESSVYIATNSPQLDGVKMTNITKDTSIVPNMDEKDQYGINTSSQINSDKEKNIDCSVVITQPDPELKSTPGSEDERDDDRNIVIFRYCRTSALIFTWIVMGLASSIVGPTQIDLQERMGCDVTTADMSKALSTRSFGNIFGSTLFAVLNHRYCEHGDLLMAIILFLTGSTVILKPWANELWLLALLYFFEGFASQNVVGNAMITTMWGKKAAVPMHFMHFGFTVGKTIAPLLAMPFLSKDTLCPDVNSTYTNSTTTMTSTIEQFEDVSRIEIPYGIAGGLSLLMCIIFLIIYIAKLANNFPVKGAIKRSYREIFSPTRCSAGSTSFSVIILLLVCIFWFLFQGRTSTMNNYLFTYAVETGLMDKQEASLLDSAYGAASMLGRGLAIPISHFVAIQPLLFGEVYINTVWAACLALLGTTDSLYLWIFSCLFSAFESPIYPSGLSWLDKYIILGSVIVALLDVVASVGGIVFQLAVGHFFTYTNPDYMMYMGFVLGLGMCVLLVIMQIVSSMRGTRFSREDALAEENPAELSLEQMNYGFDAIDDNPKNEISTFKPPPVAEIMNDVQVTRM